MRYHQNTENPNKICIVFLGKLVVFFTRFRAINFTNWKRTETSKLDHLEE